MSVQKRRKPLLRTVADIRNFPAIYLGGAGTSTSNDQFKTGSNYANGGTAYFAYAKLHRIHRAPTSERPFLELRCASQLAQRSGIQGRGYDSGQVLWLA